MWLKQLFSDNEIYLNPKFRKIWNQLKTKNFCFQQTPRIIWKIEVLANHVNLSVFQLETAPVTTFLSNQYLFKVSNRNTRKKSEICSNLTIQTPEPRH